MGQLRLNGIRQLRSADGQRGKTQFSDRDQTDSWRLLDAHVPGSVHLDLMRHGLIGDPSNGLNALAARWVEERTWSYRREFETPAAIEKNRKIWLYFERLDYAARIVLNGEEIGRHANFFVRAGSRSPASCGLELADNFFDLFPNEPYTLLWPHKTPPRVLFVGNSLGDRSHV